MKIIRKILLTGIVGTFSTDIWTIILKVFGVHSHGLLLVGQWIISHLSLSSQKELEGKALYLGWTAHYCLGMLFAFVPIALYGQKWLHRPTFATALITGLTTFMFSIFIIQPILNFGVAFSEYTGQPIILLKVALFHIVYCIGLYGTARIIANCPKTQKT
ncbi:DUF2938 family protein [Chryseobacterium cucumeris]